jgi:hypothetical protein
MPVDLEGTDWTAPRSSRRYWASSPNGAWMSYRCVHLARQWASRCPSREQSGSTGRCGSVRLPTTCSAAVRASRGAVLSRHPGYVSAANIALVAAIMAGLQDAGLTEAQAVEVWTVSETWLWANCGSPTQSGCGPRRPGANSTRCSATSPLPTQRACDASQAPSWTKLPAPTSPPGCATFSWGSPEGCLRPPDRYRILNLDARKG